MQPKNALATTESRTGQSPKIIRWLVWLLGTFGPATLTNPPMGWQNPPVASARGGPPLPPHRIFNQRLLLLHPKEMHSGAVVPWKITLSPCSLSGVLYYFARCSKFAISKMRYVVEGECGFYFDGFVDYFEISWINCV